MLWRSNKTSNTATNGRLFLHFPQLAVHPLNNQILKPLSHSCQQCQQRSSRNLILLLSHSRSHSAKTCWRLQSDCSRASLILKKTAQDPSNEHTAKVLCLATSGTRVRTNVWQNNIQPLLWIAFEGPCSKLHNLPWLAYPGSSTWYRRGLYKNRIKNLFTG